MRSSLARIKGLEGPGHCAIEMNRNVKLMENEKGEGGRESSQRRVKLGPDVGVKQQEILHGKAAK